MAEETTLNRRQRIGRWGERVAEEFLLVNGYQVLDRNVHTTYGEIDLVTLAGDQVVFVEVKTRTNLAYGHPEISVTQRKQNHLTQSAEAYLTQHPELGEDWRIDVIAIQGCPGGADPEIVHFENAIG
jgi:putative endonuclease